jgi:hypothetical protein
MSRGSSEPRRDAVQFSAWSKPSRRTDSEHSRKRRIHLAFVLSTPSEIGSPACLIAHGRVRTHLLREGEWSRRRPPPIETDAEDAEAGRRGDRLCPRPPDPRMPFKTLSILNEITSRGAAYRSLTEPWADTTHELGELLAALVGYIARKTREDIIRRTTAGRKRARANGVKFGRKSKLSPAQRRQALARRAAGESQSAIARSYQVSCSTISRLEQDARTINSLVSGVSARGAERRDALQSNVPPHLVQR